MVVHAEADDVVARATGERVSEKHGGWVSPLEVEVFGLGAPFRCEHPFRPRALASVWASSRMGGAKQEDHWCLEARGGRQGQDSTGLCRRLTMPAVKLADSGLDGVLLEIDLRVAVELTKAQASPESLLGIPPNLSKIFTSH